jgi:thiamine-phosphate pyrophosphorylase
MTVPSDERLRRRELLRHSPVYLVTEEAFSGGRPSEEIAEAALEAGVRVVQVREKEGTAKRALQIAVNLRDATRRHGALLIVNDRIDVAIASDADGVHLGQDDLPIELARLLLGNDALVGLSITEARQLEADDAADADYLGVGAVFPTGTKSDAALTGLALLDAAREARAAREGLLAAAVPIVAIGGITAANAGRAIEAGADGVAVVTAITRAADPAAAARELEATVAGARERLEAAGAAADSAVGREDRAKRKADR